MNNQTESKQDLPDETALLKAALEASARNLDAASLSRLNRARQAALDAAQPRRPRWFAPLAWAAGAAASAVLALALLPLLRSGPAPVAPAQAPTEFAVLTDQVDPALLEDLEFYAWLDSQAGEDAWEG
jgi:ferric-dicitrate binding protein FerR (iron transport regulator)